MAETQMHLVSLDITLFWTSKRKMMVLEDTRLSSNRKLASSRKGALEGRLPLVRAQWMGDPTPDSRRSSSLKPCGLLGSALSERYSSTDACIEGPSVPDEDLLRVLFLTFPHGQVFNSSQTNGDARDPVHQAVMGKLFQTFPDADSLMFVPLEHCDRSRWLSATMVWDCERRMGDDDLNYLKVIGDLITCEIARIDGSSLEKSKSDLLSSISHELRSPLHGLLANTELLQSTDLDPTQSEMVTMVETCGKTLLDTMNCLLDFAKINTLTQTQKGSSNVTTDLNGLVTEFNLSSLVEEVANSVYAGHRHLNETLKSSGRIWPVQEGPTSIEVGPERKPDDFFGMVQADPQTIGGYDQSLALGDASS